MLHPVYVIVYTLFFFQVSIGLLLSIKERYDIDDESHQRLMSYLNDLAVWLIFLSVTVHVFVSVFVEHNNVPLNFEQYIDLMRECNSNSTKKP